jgi:chromosome segregation ATPase
MDFEALESAFDQLMASNTTLRQENEVMKRYYTRAVPTAVLDVEDEADKEARKKDAKKKKSRKENRVLPLLLSADHKVDIMVREIDEMRNAIERAKLQAERHLDELKAEMEEVDTEIAEVKKDAYEFRRDIVVGAENPRTGKVVAERLQRYMEDAIKEKDAMIDKFRLKNSALKSQISKLETQLKQREEMGEVLLLIDFDQLRIENQQYIDRIEEKNKELLALKLTTANTVAILNALKEKLSKMTTENSTLQADIDNKRDALEKFTAELDAVRTEEESQQKLNSTLAQQQEETKAPEVMQYIQQKAELQSLEQEVKRWQRKVEISENQIKVNRGLLKDLTKTQMSSSASYR